MGIYARATSIANTVDMSITKPSPEGEGWVRLYKSDAYIMIPLTPTLSREERELLRQPPEGEGVRVLNSTALSSSTARNIKSRLKSTMKSGETQ